MTAINRTAYPRPEVRLTREELGERYHLSDAEPAFVHASARGDTGRLLLAMLLKSRCDFGYFPAPASHGPANATVSAAASHWRMARG